MRGLIVAAAMLAAGPALAQGAFSEESEADSWNLFGEEKARFEGRVVDALCALTGDCPVDCGAGARQMGIVRAARPRGGGGRGLRRGELLMRPWAALVLVTCLAPGVFAPAAQAHDGVEHGTPGEDATQATAAGPALPFPVEIRPRFDLIDHTGRVVTEADFAGRPMAIFFGYASCESICSVALPRVGAALNLLGNAGAEVAAVMITVDPARDTPAALAEAPPAHHPRLIGLTGTEAALAKARAAFQVEVSRVAETHAGAPVYAHGSFIYLVGRDGVVKSVLPPVLAPERIAALIRRLL